MLSDGTKYYDFDDEVLSLVFEMEEDVEMLKKNRENIETDKYYLCKDDYLLKLFQSIAQRYLYRSDMIRFAEGKRNFFEIEFFGIFWNETEHTTQHLTRQKSLLVPLSNLYHHFIMFSS